MYDSRAIDSTDWALSSSQGTSSVFQLDSGDPLRPDGRPVIAPSFLFFFAQQQDVSEFTHKLLDWLEDAFQMKAEEER